jgi:hypothetical protein
MRMKKGQHKSTICVGKALGKTGIPKRMLANEVKLAIKDVGKALGKTR